jgi:hypothetical protein
MAVAQQIIFLMNTSWSLVQRKNTTTSGDLQNQREGVLQQTEVILGLTPYPIYLIGVLIKQILNGLIDGVVCI